MKSRQDFFEILFKFWWVVLIIIGAVYFLTDIPIIKYILYVIGIFIALSIFLPFIIQFFAPAFVLTESLVEHFRQSKSMPFGKRYIFIPMSILSAISFSTAQMILSTWIFILAFITWAGLIGFFWTFFLSFFFGLAPLTILTAPFILWIKEGFAAFFGMGIFYLMTILWFFFLSLAYSDDYLTSEDYIGYSPHMFLLGALSFQVIALPFYHFNLYNIANYISDLGGFIFLILALIAAIKWRSIKRKLPIEDKENIYRPSFWIYILGFLFTNILYVIFQNFDAPTAVIFWLNGFFLFALIGRFFGIFRRNKKVETLIPLSLESYNDHVSDFKNLYNNGEYAEALSIIDQIIDSRYVNRNHYYYRAILYNKMKNNSKCLLDLKKAASLGHGKSSSILQKRGISF